MSARVAVLRSRDAAPGLAVVFSLLLGLGVGYGIASELGDWILLALTAPIFLAALLVVDRRLIVALWLFLTPFLAFYIKLELPAGIPDLTAARIFALLALGTTVLRVLARGMSPAVRRPDVWLLLFVALRSISAFRSSGALTEGLYILLDGLWLPLVMYLVVMRVFDCARDVSRIQRVIVWLAILGGGLGLVESALSLDRSIFDYLGASTGVFGVWKHEGVRRAAGPFLNPSSYGAFSGVAALIALERWVVGGFGRRSAPMVLVLSLACVFFSLTRGAWLGTACGFLAFSWFSRSGRGVWFVPVAALLLAIGAGVASEDQSDAVGQRFGSEATVYTRLALADRAVKMMGQAPILGHGFGGFNQGHADVLSDFGSPDQLVSHNTYLTAAVDSGLPALLVLLAALGRCLWRVGRQARAQSTSLESRMRLASLGGGVVIYAASALFVDMIYIGFDSTVWFLLIAMLNFAVDGSPRTPSKAPEARCA